MAALSHRLGGDRGRRRHRDGGGDARLRLRLRRAPRRHQGRAAPARRPDGRPTDDLVARGRQAAERGRQGTLGHHDPPARHRRRHPHDVDPARPENRRHSWPRRPLEDERRLHLRWARAHDEGREATDRPADKPRRERRLHRLRGRGQLDRLRVLRCRPSLLPLERRPLGVRPVRGDQHPRRLPAHVRLQRPPVRALPPRRQRPRPRRSAAGVPARGAQAGAADEDLQRHQQPHAHRRQVHVHRPDAEGLPDSPQPGEADRLGRWSARHPGPLPGDHRLTHRPLRHRPQDRDPRRGPSVPRRRELVSVRNAGTGQRRRREARSRGG